jgi:hypothetical protein
MTGKPAKCEITFSPAGEALSGDNLSDVMAHEVWHCFQGAANMGTFWSGTEGPVWIVEGEAEWVGDSLFPGAPIAGDFWPRYLRAPATGIFGRSYDAVGFYSQLESSGIDVWTRLMPIYLAATGNPGAFDAAGGNSDQFLDVWAAGFFRDPSRGEAWQISGPGVTNDRAKPTPLSVPDGGSADVAGPAYADAIYALDASSDVVTATISGHARISDSQGNDYLVQDKTDFCTRADGCECPPDSPNHGLPLHPLLGGDFLALSGGRAAAKGSVSGMSLEDYCGTSIVGTWRGTWASNVVPGFGGTFSLTFAKRGNALSGPIHVAGSVCVHDGTVTGTLNGSQITFGTVNAGPPVHYDGAVKGGTMSGRYLSPSCRGESDNGTWQATKAPKG